jgi:hypothetical protein
MVGKNIRISDFGWSAIRKYCQENNLVMGGFVERAAMREIEASFKTAPKGNKSKKQPKKAIHNS